MEKYAVGNIFKNRYNTKYEIIEKLNKDYRKIVFLDDYRHEKIVSICCIKNNTVKNPYDKSVHNIGMLGLVSIMQSKYIRSKSYSVWKEIIRRCYDEDDRFKFKSYINVTVCEEWLCYENFKNWYDATLPTIDNINFQLDKDILQQGVENKIYSPDTCIFLPERVNKYLINYDKEYESKGCYFDINRNLWVSRGTSFMTSKTIHYGRFKTLEEAHENFIQGKIKENKLAYNYLKELNYLNEDILELIK